jgi:copper chaperone CopZ
MYYQQFKITNLSCEACQKLSQGVLDEIPGVISVEVDLKSGLTKIEAEKEISWQDIAQSLAEIDKKVEPLTK